jgi:hypothetical protein
MSSLRPPILTPLTLDANGARRVVHFTVVRYSAAQVYAPVHHLRVLDVHLSVLDRDLFVVIGLVVFYCDSIPFHQLGVILAAGDVL